MDDAFEHETLPWIGDVARFAISLSRDESEADDLVQETYLRAQKGWHTFQPGSDARRWLFTICRNVFLRRQERRHRLVLSDEGDLDSLAAVISHVDAVRSDLGDLFDRMEVGPAIRRAVAALPEPHHSVVVLVDLEGLSYDEAAEVLEVPVGTVRSRLFRARRIVQEELVEYAKDMGIAAAAGRSDPSHTKTGPDSMGHIRGDSA